MTKPKIGVIIGSIRPNRFGDKPAKWIADIAKASGHFDVEIVDLVDYPLPLFDAPASDMWMPTPNETAAKWQAKLNEFDGFIIVTAEVENDLPIPGEPFSFGVLEMAQALGDFESLDSAGRRALHIHLPRRDVDLLKRVFDRLLKP